MADAISGNTELGATKQELIASLVQKELAFKSKLLPTITDVSMFAVEGSKSISFPKLTSFTAVNRTEGAAGDATALTASVDTMVLDQNAYIAWIIDAMTKKQANINAELEFAKRAASAHARYVDSAIIAELASVAFSFQNVGADADITAQDVRDMRTLLLKENASLEDLVLIISPDQEKVLLGIADFVRSDSYGNNPTAIASGVIGRLYGVPVIVHNGLTQYQAFMYDKNAIVLGFQKNPEMDEQKANEYGVGAVRVAMDCLFGVQGTQIAVGSAAAGKSALVVGLND